jgi:hypothetical protein
MGNLSIIRILICFSLLPLLAACNDENSKIFISSMRAKATFENIPDLPASAVVDINFELSGTQGNQINSIEAYSNLNGKQELIQTLSADQRSFTWTIPEAKNIGLIKEKESKPAQLLLKVIGRTATTENLSNSFNVVNMGTMSINSKVFFKNTTSFEIGTCAYNTAIVTPYCNTMTGTGVSGGSCTITCTSGKLTISNLPAAQNDTVLNVSTFIGINLKNTAIKIQHTPVFYIDAQAPKVTSFQFLEPFTDQIISIAEGERKVISTTKVQTLNFTVQDNPNLPENKITTSLLIDNQASTVFSESTHCTGSNPKTCSISNLFISQTKGEHKISIKSTDTSGNTKQSDFLIFYEPTAKPVITTLTASKNPNIAAIESGDNLSGLSDYSTDVASYQNGSGTYYVRFKAADPDDHATLQPQLMKNKSGLKSIVISAVDKVGTETNPKNVLDSFGKNTSDCSRASVQSTGIGQYYCAKITASIETKYIKVNATDRSGNTATRIFRINLGVGTRVMAGADSGPINFSGNQSASFSKAFGTVRSDRGFKIDNKNIIYLLKFENSYSVGGLYTVHPRDGIVRKIVSFNGSLSSSQLSTPSSEFSFARPYQTSSVTSFDLDAQDNSILYLYELRKQTDNKYKANIRKFKLTYTIQTADNIETPSLSMKEEVFQHNQQSTIESNTTVTSNSFTSVPEPTRMQVYSIEKGLFFTSYEQSDYPTLYMNSLIDNNLLPSQKMDTPVYTSETSKIVEFAAPVMVGDELYYLTQNSKSVPGNRHFTIAIIQSNSNQTALITDLRESEDAYARSISLNKKGELDRAVVFTQGGMSRYSIVDGKWKTIRILSGPISASGYTKDGEYLKTAINITLNDVVPLEDNSLLMIDGSLIRLLEPLTNGTQLRLTTLMGENPGTNPSFKNNTGLEVYTVTHPLSLKMGLLSNLKPFGDQKLATYDHSAGKIFEFTSDLKSVKHVAGNGESGAASSTVEATLSPTYMNGAGLRASTVGYNSSGNILYGHIGLRPVLELVGSKFATSTALTIPILNKSPITKLSKTSCLDGMGGDYSNSTYQYSLVSDSADFQAVSSHYFDYTCNNARSSHIKIIDGSTSLTIGNSDVLANGRNSPSNTTSTVPSCFTNNVDMSNCTLNSQIHNADSSHGQVSKVGNDYWVSHSYYSTIIKVNNNSPNTILVFKANRAIYGFAPFKEASGSQSIYACEGGLFSKWTGLEATATKAPSTLVPEVPCRPGNLVRRSVSSNSILFLMPQDDTGTSVVEFNQSP